MNYERRISELEERVNKLELVIVALAKRLNTHMEDHDDPLSPAEREAIALNMRFG